MRVLRKLFFVFGCGVFVSSIHAAIYSVPGNYATIQACANAANPGDTCTIAAGSYNEYVSLPRSGTSGNRITFDTLSGAKLRGFSLSGRSYITIKGFEITNQGLDRNAGSTPIYLVDSNHIQIFDNLIHDTSGDDHTNGAAISIGDAGGHSSSFNHIKGNTIRNCSVPAQGGTHAGEGIQVYGNENLIEENDISHLGDDFTRVLSGARNVIRNNVWHDNVPSDWPGWVNLPANQLPHIDGMQNFSLGGEAPFQYLLMENNVMRESWDTNSHFALFQNYAHSDQRDMVFRFNTGYRIGDGTLSADSAPTPNIRVYNNTWAVVWDGEYGNNDGIMYFSGGSTGGKIFNNIFFNTGMLTGYSPYNHTSDSAAGFSSDYNMVFVTGYSGTWRAPIGAEAHNADILNKDPLFVSYPSDFSLQSTSPLIDKGGPLTTALNTGNNSLTLTVGDAGFFQDGWGGGSENGVLADTIAIGSANNTARISSISGNTITLATQLTWSVNAPVYLFRDSSGRQVLNGSAPDIGAYEFNGTGTTSLPHPADSNSDFLMVLNEATKYGACWKNPAAFGDCPSGIAIDYAVRAGTLWSATANGQYQYNSVNTCPLCWEVKP